MNKHSKMKTSPQPAETGVQSREKTVILLVVVLAVVAIVAVAGLIPRARHATPGQANQAARPRLLDLGADKCIPCKKMAPILEELKQEYAGRMDVEFIDVWKNRDAARPYGIETIPTQVFFDASGKEIYRHVGFFSKEEILAKWKELGVGLKN
jgi:thioredoxin 1